MEDRLAEPAAGPLGPLRKTHSQHNADHPVLATVIFRPDDFVTYHKQVSSSTGYREKSPWPSERPPAIVARGIGLARFRLGSQASIIDDGCEIVRPSVSRVREEDGDASLENVDRGSGRRIAWCATSAADEPKLVPEEGSVELVLLRHKAVRDELKLTHREARKIHEFTEAQWNKALEAEKLTDAKERDRDMRR